jgi:hypothetical protein
MIDAPIKTTNPLIEIAPLGRVHKSRLAMNCIGRGPIAVKTSIDSLERSQLSQHLIPVKGLACGDRAS